MRRESNCLISLRARTYIFIVFVARLARKIQYRFRHNRISEHVANFEVSSEHAHLIVIFSFSISFVGY